MPNRPMQAKALKLKKQRRLFPKSYSADYIKCPGNLDRTLMSEAKQRAKGLAFDDEYMKHIEEKQRFKGVPAGRFEVLKIIEELRKDLDDDMRFVVIENSKDRKVQLFYNAEQTTYLIVEMVFENLIVRTSMKYMDKERCLLAWRTDKLRWVYVKSLTDIK
jgi:hypothetical protein